MQMILFLIVLGGAGLATAFFYNQLVRQRNMYKNAFTQIDVQLKRRYDLIPNLVEAAKAYLKHERETLEAVIAARNQAHKMQQFAAAKPGDPKLMQQFAQAEGALGQQLGRLLVSVEAYPELKANQNVAQLMEELSSTENRIAFARQAYNDAIMTYNNTREVFPSNLIAINFSFAAAEGWTIERPEQREAVRVAM